MAARINVSPAPGCECPSFTRWWRPGLSHPWRAADGDHRTDSSGPDTGRPPQTPELNIAAFQTRLVYDCAQETSARSGPSPGIRSIRKDSSVISSDDLDAFITQPGESVYPCAQCANAKKMRERER